MEDAAGADVNRRAANAGQVLALRWSGLVRRPERMEWKMRRVVLKVVWYETSGGGRRESRVPRGIAISGLLTLTRRRERD
jgi:hypothetical protein